MPRRVQSHPERLAQLEARWDAPDTTDKPTTRGASHASRDVPPWATTADLEAALEDPYTAYAPDIAYMSSDDASAYSVSSDTKEYTYAARTMAPQVHQRVHRPSVPRTVRLMYAWCSGWDVSMLLVPGLLFAALSGGIPVAMTHIVGRAFAAFAAFDGHSAGAQHALMRSVCTDVYVLLALAAGTLVLRSAAMAAWLLLAEHGVAGWRAYVFRALRAKPISWFDLGMGIAGERTDVGAAGLMALVSKDTDEIRTAMGLQMCHLLTHAAAALASFGYAMYRCWSLTLVVFASIPLLVAATIAGDVLGAPRHAAERAQSVQLAALVETCVAAIRTVKAFNAQRMQLDHLTQCIETCRTMYTRLCVVWGVRYGICAALGLVTFVQGFAYGSYLVRHHHTGSDVILATFLASLVAMGQLQSILMRLNVVERGKNAAADLLALATSQPTGADVPVAGTPAQRSVPPAAFSSHYEKVPCKPRRFTPPSCVGTMALEHVWMAYPTRPDVPVLRGVSMHFAAGEHTFVVGRSGSGKSSVANALLQLHAPQAGVVTLDAHNVQTLDPAFFRTHVAGVTQEPLVLGCSLYENVALGAHIPQTSASVRDAVAAACLDEVLDLLPEGLDTPLAHRGTDLSGGQKQRVALARALLRDPAVLILDEATSALDAARAARVHDAVRAWRHGRTTIVITHNLAHVRAEDYCYVLENGDVVEEGYCGMLSQRDGWLTRVYNLAPPPRAKEDGAQMPSVARLPLRPFEESSEQCTNNAAEPRYVAARHKVQTAAGEEASSAAPSRSHASYALLWDTARTMAATLPHRAWLCVALVVCIASGITIPAFAFCLTRVLMVIGRASTAPLPALIGATAGVAVADGVCKGTRLLAMEALTARWVASMRTKALARVVNQDARWFDAPENAPSTLAQRVVKDAEDAGACLGQMLGQLVALGAMILATLVWALVQGWQLTLCALALFPLVLVLYSAQGTLAARTELVSKDARERVAQHLFDQVACVRAVRALALEDALEGDALRAVHGAAHAGRRSAYAAAAGAGLAEATTYAAEALLYGVGAVLLARQTYDLHRFMMVLNPVIFAVGFAAQLAASLPAGSKCMHALRAVARLLYLATTPSDASGKARPVLHGGVEFVGVQFAYGPTQVLDRVSFRIAPGERVALVGASGAGKSTVAALLQRLYEPDGGAVFFDGHWAPTVCPAWLRRHLAVVSQMPTLFPGTVRANITLGRPSSDAEVRRAAQRAQADDFLQALPARYATQLGNKATHLSGGQAQRLAVARALLRTEARLLLLDEFTAALDPATRSAVADAVLAGGAHAPSVLLLTHDPQLVRRCDRVVALEAGRVVYDGEPGKYLLGATKT